jgi:hypothetical protein
MMLATADCPARAQSDVRMRIRESADALTTAAALSRLDAAQRVRTVEFIGGSALFILTHEVGHAVIGEFNLPVLGRVEDAADSFATLALLHVGTEFTHDVLVDAARNLLLIGERKLGMGVPPAFYDEHGLDQQRAYTIVCLMVGSDPATFSDLAERAKLPAERRETCQIDYEQAKDSWLQLLRPHFRAEAQPSFWERLIAPRTRLLGTPPSTLAINYGEAPGSLEPFREIAKTLRLLEIVRDFTAKNFNFPRPLTVEAKTCGVANAFWDPQERSVTLCYELLAADANVALSP